MSAETSGESSGGTDATQQPRFADLDPSERFESGWNRLQTGVEVMVGLIVLAGLAGLLGNGPLSPRVETFGSMPLQMTYQRVLRRTAPSQIEIRTTAPLPDDQLEVELPNALATDMDVVATSPRSAAMRAERDGIVYTFALGVSRQGTITFTVKPRSAGLVRSVVKSGAAEAMLRQVVLP